MQIKCNDCQWEGVAAECPSCGGDARVMSEAKCRSLQDEIAGLKEELEAIDHYFGDGYIAAGQRKRIQIVGNYRNPKLIL